MLTFPTLKRYIPTCRDSLARCELTQPVFKELGSLLSSGTSRLKSLSVGLNRVGDEGVRHLWAAIAHPNCLLEELEWVLLDQDRTFSLPVYVGFLIGLVSRQRWNDRLDGRMRQRPVCRCASQQDTKVSGAEEQFADWCVCTSPHPSHAGTPRHGGAVVSLELKESNFPSAVR